uniref:Sperm protamine P1 n=1 Tax=Kogia sima TaxID=9752 RepID=C8C437_KOGSI|nr:protamine P1 [Kogia sima]
MARNRCCRSQSRGRCRRPRRRCRSPKRRRYQRRRRVCCRRSATMRCASQ